MTLGNDFKGVEVVLSVTVEVNLEQSSTFKVDIVDATNPGLMNVILAHELGDLGNVLFIDIQSRQVGFVVFAAAFVLAGSDALLGELEFSAGGDKCSHEGDKEGENGQAVHIVFVSVVVRPWFNFVPSFYRHDLTEAKMCPIEMLLFLVFLQYFKYSQGVCSDDYLYLSKANVCPEGFNYAKLDDQESWNKAMNFTTKCLGYNAAVKIASGLSWKGEGLEDWMLVTPDHANGAETGRRLPDLPPFVRNKRGKLALNFYPNRQVPTLCAKNSTDQ